MKKLVKKVEDNAESKVVNIADEVADEANEEVSDVVENEAGEEIGAATEYPEQLNEDEKEALANTAPEDISGEVSTVKMNAILDLITAEFYLTGKNYTVQQYKDGGSKVSLALANSDYDITVTVKDVYSKVSF